MDTTKISFDVSNSDPSAQLGFEAWFNNIKFFDTDHITDTVTITYDFPDEEQECCLRLVLKNKLPIHTKISNTGDIISDARLFLKNLAFDEIKLEQLFYKLAVYRHDTNGTTPVADHKFYGELGCNGELILNFSTPIYLWLLENM